jgi:AcrR family transcriptional regulator
MPKVSEQHAAARRRQIVEAASRCFARRGFHRTTMKDIFRESGLSPGAVYTYFFGKDDLIAAVAEDAARGDADPDLLLRLRAEALDDPRIRAALRPR